MPIETYSRQLLDDLSMRIQMSERQYFTLWDIFPGNFPDMPPILFEQALCPSQNSPKTVGARYKDYHAFESKHQSFFWKTSPPDWNYISCIFRNLI